VWGSKDLTSPGQLILTCAQAIAELIGTICTLPCSQWQTPSALSYRRERLQQLFP
jgi:hypothetical protein